MIEKTDFGDVFGGSALGCHCQGQCNACSCDCSWPFGDKNDSASNFNTGFAENLNTSYWIKEHS